MPDENLLQAVEREFTATILRARQTIRERARAIHPQLQAPGYRILSILMQEDGQQQGYLAEQLEVDKATISRIVKQLEVQGLITRVTDPSDGRAQLVFVTPAARASWETSGNEARQRLRNRLSEWTDEDVKRLADLLGRLNRAAEEEEQPEA